MKIRVPANALRVRVAIGPFEGEIAPVLTERDNFLTLAVSAGVLVLPAEWVRPLGQARAA